jgi:hypothetical protein
MAETSFLHEELMQEEGLSIRDIPVELQRQVKGFNVHKKKYEENPSDKEENRLIRLSTQLANNIQNWIENQSDEEDEDEDEDDRVEVKTASKKQSEEDSNVGKRRSAEKPSNELKSEQKLENKAEFKKPVTTGVSFGNFVMEKKIKSICDANGGRIKITQLVSIINKEPEYPEQRVHNIKLRKVFLSSDYRII